ncbi:hypothetical protein PAL_GLEAN10005362 [Pteropus alecto]|uniref:Uncharacterized protein n=1 Tax=Pteropus alecto TaxID=9402 RepID=L5JW96_PTEAL|nr:hypothetical protein PAL_GLEAN10005362 [Pteropus alecto]
MGRGRRTRGAAASTAVHGGRGSACRLPFLWCPGCPAPEAQKEKQAKQVPALKDVRVPGASHTLGPQPSLRRSCRRPSFPPCHHQACSEETPNLPNLSDVTVSPPTWAPGPAPALPVLRFRLSLQRGHLPEPSAPGPAGPARPPPLAVEASSPPMRGREDPGLLRAEG